MREALARAIQAQEMVIENLKRDILREMQVMISMEKLVSQEDLVAISEDTYTIARIQQSLDIMNRTMEDIKGYERDVKVMQQILAALSV